MSLPLTPGAVIWDMDGTLIDQTVGIIRCYSEVVAALGHPKPDPGKFIEAWEDRWRRPWHSLFHRKI